MVDLDLFDRQSGSGEEVFRYDVDSFVVTVGKEISKEASGKIVKPAF